jgi:hypothetical protein
MGVGSWFDAEGLLQQGYFDGQGIYRCTADSYINHGVVIAGYNDAGGYWIVKNSWGPTWNGDGYFKVGYGECAVEQYAVYAYLEADIDSDNDNDGFTDEVETYLRTDPLDACPDNPSDDAWPPDVNMDTQVNLFDVMEFVPHLPSAVGDLKYDRRVDMNADGSIDLFDLMTLVPFLGTQCGP